MTPARLNRRADVLRQQSFDRVRAEIAERLAAVCSHMDPQEFEALVRRAAEIEIKYAQRRTETFGRALEG
jgi:hypothetical protein